MITNEQTETLCGKALQHQVNKSETEFLLTINHKNYTILYEGSIGIYDDDNSEQGVYFIFACHDLYSPKLYFFSSDIESIDFSTKSIVLKSE